MNTLTPTQIELLKNNTEDIKAISLAWLMMDNATQNSWDVSFDSFASQFEDKKEWKILSFSPQSGGNPCTFFAGDYDIGIKERLKEGRKIHSVQYKSETLTVGDDTDKGKIKRFIVTAHSNRLLVDTGMIDNVDISEVKKIERKPIMTTSDGVVVYDIEGIFMINTSHLEWKIYTLKSDTKQIDELTCCYFKSKEKATEYVLLNSPKLSVNDVLDNTMDEE